MNDFRAILALGALSTALYALMPVAGTRVAVIVTFGLTALMLAGWRLVRRNDPRVWTAALVFAAVFRLALVAAPPVLSDDVYRSVWDGRVQAAGHHPYKFAPSDPMRRELRDEAIYPRLDHPEVPTIHPPLAEMSFAALALARAGVTGFKLAAACLDLGAIAALLALLRALGVPRDRAILYAWNPLPVIETAWSGHVEPLGILLMLLALTAIERGRAVRAAAALAAAVQASLLPLILVPGLFRRMKARAVIVFVGVVVLLALPYALRGPSYGAGVLAYAHRWEHGSIVFPSIVRAYESMNAAPALDAAIGWVEGRWGSADTRVWDMLHGNARSQELARLTVAALAVGWALAQSFRPRLNAAHEARLALGGCLLLAPTLYPWHVLWVLPLAAAAPSGGWLLLGALAPLQYLVPQGDPWGLRLLILLPPIAWMAWDSLRAWERRRAARDAI